MGGSESGGDAVLECDIRRRVRGREVEDQVAASTPLIAAIDIGTTLMKCLIYNSKGHILGRRSEPIVILRPEPSRVEIDPEQLWRQFQTCYRNALSNAQVSATEITSIGISTQRNTFTTWDSETGEPFHNLIVCNDQRAIQYVKDWNRSLSLKAYHWVAFALFQISRVKKFLLASNMEFSLAQVGVRLRWMIDNNQRLRDRIRDQKVKFGCIETWLLWKLSGGRVHATDYSCASATGLYDPFILDYSWIMMTLVGVPHHIWPEVRDTTGPFCHTDAQVFGAAIPVNAVVGDQQAAMFGQCGFHKGDVKATFGTGTFCNVNTALQPLATIAGLYPIVGWKIKELICYLAEGCSMDTGTTILWGISAGFFDSPEESEMIANSAADSGGICFIPAFSGIQAPINDDDACTGIIGITATTTKAQIVRALLESLAFRMYHIYSLATSDPAVDTSQLRLIRVDGGVSRNRFVMQLVADLTGLSLDFPDDCDSSVLGAAFLAGIAAGVWKDTEEVSQLRKTKAVLIPRSTQERDKIMATYRIWVKAISRCCKWFPS